MLGIADGAACVGLQTMTAAAATHELGDIKLPCILHWNQEHFVVLYEISKNGKRYKVADPGKGLITYTKKEFESHWLSSMTDGEPSGIVMQLTPTEEFYKHDYEKTEENVFSFPVRLSETISQVFHTDSSGTGSRMCASVADAVPYSGNCGFRHQA